MAESAKEEPLEEAAATRTITFRRAKRKPSGPEPEAAAQEDGTADHEQTLSPAGSFEAQSPTGCEQTPTGADVSHGTGAPADVQTQCDALSLPDVSRSRGIQTQIGAGMSLDEDAPDELQATGRTGSPDCPCTARMRGTDEPPSATAVAATADSDPGVANEDGSEIVLPAVLDVPRTGELFDQIASCEGSLAINAAGVRFICTPALQVLLAAAADPNRRAAGFSLCEPSAGFLACTDRLGIPTSAFTKGSES